MKNRKMSALGKLGKGRKKTMTAAAIKARRRNLRKARWKRWE
jgi:hypothetical protein